jgi:serine/threonine-protein kinase RIM15
MSFPEDLQRRTLPTRVDSLAPPANEELTRKSMERSPSMTMRAEREDLKEAAEESYNVIMDLDLDGKVRWLSPSWDQVIG